MSLADAAAADDALRPVRRARPRAPIAPAAAEVRRRMQDIIVGHLTMSSGVTERDLESAGFSRTEIADHFTAACRAVRAGGMA